MQTHAGFLESMLLHLRKLSPENQKLEIMSAISKINDAFAKYTDIEDSAKKLDRKADRDHKNVDKKEKKAAKRVKAEKD